jgi:hypothetical protein
LEIHCLGKLGEGVAKRSFARGCASLTLTQLRLSSLRSLRLRIPLPSRERGYPALGRQMMRVSDGDRERVRCIRAGDLHAGEQARDHGVDLRLFRAARADDGLLDQSRGIFADLDPRSRRAHQGDSSRLAELQRRLRVLVDEHLFDRGSIGAALADQRLKLVGKDRETLRQGQRRARLDLPVGDVRQAIALGLDQSPTGGAEPGIQAEDLQASRSNSSSGTS